MKIPKFENEIDEANWAFEHREAPGGGIHK